MSTPTTSVAALNGKWLAMDDDRSKILASADRYTDLMKMVAELGLDDPVIERAPGWLPCVAERSLELLPGETADLLSDIRGTISQADQWLDTPNAFLWCEKPRDLINTPREASLRDLVRGLQSGITS